MKQHARYHISHAVIGTLKICPQQLFYIAQLVDHSVPVHEHFFST